MKIRGTTVSTPIKPEKVLVKSENLTEEEKAIARANIGAASEEVIGLIDAALVTIIDYQEEFIGTDDNVSTITFFVDEFEYTAEEGMTFAKWVESTYNSHDFYCNERDMVCDGAGKTVNLDADRGPAYGSDLITPGWRYTFIVY